MFVNKYFGLIQLSVDVSRELCIGLPYRRTRELHRLWRLLRTRRRRNDQFFKVNVDLAPGNARHLYDDDVARAKTRWYNNIVKQTPGKVHWFWIVYSNRSGFTDPRMYLICAHQSAIAIIRASGRILFTRSNWNGPTQALPSISPPFVPANWIAPAGRPAAPPPECV